MGKEGEYIINLIHSRWQTGHFCRWSSWTINQIVLFVFFSISKQNRWCNKFITFLRQSKENSLAECLFSSLKTTRFLSFSLSLSLPFHLTIFNFFFWFHRLKYYVYSAIHFICIYILLEALGVFHTVENQGALECFHSARIGLYSQFVPFEDFLTKKRPWPFILGLYKCTPLGKLGFSWVETILFENYPKTVTND